MWRLGLIYRRDFTDVIKCIFSKTACICQLDKFELQTSSKAAERELFSLTVWLIDESWM